ncbi:LptA/OstA family protein [Aureimonas leprariae]|uniref:OstA family protein n=1 Tax=Plantimonas leprariae TaxID=2615207 RepID=A0A7V7PTC2_9HYPH|nr:LptA/OstA family protein [Aureimonas leprariae]KAB0682873.1 OstA family protein [Aureimonas leprariae]
MKSIITRAAILPILLLAGLQAAGAQSFGSSFTGLQVKGDQPIAIDADQLDVDDRERIATFIGNVEVTQGDTLMKTSKLLVYYTKPPAEGGAANGSAKPAPAAAPTGGALPGGSNQIDRLVASGKVYVRSADQVATSEDGNFDMKTQIAILTGNVVMSQGDNVARGDKLTIHMDTGQAQLGGGGRVKILVAPDENKGNAQGAAAQQPKRQNQARN